MNNDKFLTEFSHLSINVATDSQIHRLKLLFSLVAINSRRLRLSKKST